MAFSFKSLVDHFLKEKPKSLDAFILSCFLILITLHPFYLQGEINLFEYGLYLPGIDAVLNHQIPYRDFFHLRGPLELYIPAFFMSLMGRSASILPAYFYMGTVITLMACVFIGKELFKSRLFFYLMVPVLIARAFPRVSFTIGGGIRFAFGLMAIYCFIKFLKSKRLGWVSASGFLTTCAALTSPEVGCYIVFSIIGFLLLNLIFNWYSKKDGIKIILIYFFVTLVSIAPCIFYFVQNKAFLPFFNSIYNVLSSITKVFPQIEPTPSGLINILLAMITPGHTNFKHLTPLYCYFFIVLYIIYRWRQKKLFDEDYGIICLGLYGLVMYVMIFNRGLWGPAFETALQPEKILFFLLIERFYFFLKGCHLRQKLLVNLFLIVIIGWSLGYSIQRYNKRFFAFKFVRNVLLGKETQSLIPLAGQEQALVNIDRLKGMVVPLDQARDFEEVNQFIQKHTKPGEPIFTFPDLGVYHFIVDRPFAGRFPMITLSWISSSWHEEFMQDIRESPPRYVLMRKKLPVYFEKTNFAYLPNKKKFQELMAFIQQYYRIVFATPNVEIYGLKSEATE